MKITLYAPYLQGFYLGELANQIRQLCFLKGYDLFIVRTNSFGQYYSELGMQNCDAIILLRNSVSDQLVKKALEKNIPVVSIGYDYFPLDVALVSSNHEKGVELVFEKFEYLSELRVAFVGDISHYDIRKRFESYCEQLDRRGLNFNDGLVFETKNALADGGEKSAEEFVTQECDANVVLCGAGLTAVGFIGKLKAIAPDRAQSISVICFDAVPLIPVYCPEVTTVDPNIHLIAYRALNLLESQKAGNKIDKKTLIEPKLTKFDPNSGSDYDPFLATCVDLEALYSPAYVKSIFANMHDISREIASSGLNSILSLSPIFPKYLDRAVLVRHYKDKNSRYWIKTIKKFKRELDEPYIASKYEGVKSVDEADIFLRDEAQGESAALVIGFPITVLNKLWGFLFIKSNDTVTSLSSFVPFTAFIDEIVALFERNLESELYKKQIIELKDQLPSKSSSQASLTQNEFVVEFDLETKEYAWSQAALEFLGFKSDVEQNIYKHMDLTDRVSSESYDTVRTHLYETIQNGKPLSVTIHLKSRQGNFEECILYTLEDNPSGQSILKLYLNKSEPIED